MNLRDYFDEQRGNATRLAEELGIAHPYLWQLAQGYRGVTPQRAAAIERATGGKVTRKDLRPDDWSEIWPELAEAA